jgi:predicted ATP-grasp superfamily ATP-dependent carboligase
MRSTAQTAMPRAIVLSCAGAAEGDLNLVRSLGFEGVAVTVFAEYRGAPAAASRHCLETVLVPRFTEAPERLAEALEAYARSQPRRPVVFPSADPDLDLLSRLRGRLQATCDLALARAELIADLADKRRFAALALEHRFDVPRTWTPTSAEDLRQQAAEVRFPVIVKPSNPIQWKTDRVAGVARATKAVRVDDRPHLDTLCTALLQARIDFVIQELVPGDDDEHYDLHAFFDRDSRPVAWFTGRKHRIFPVHAGSGCYVESVAIEALARAGLQMLATLRYTGIANVNYKRDPRDGRFRLLEINPRVSQWNILAARSGINLPWLAYAEFADLKVSAPGAQRQPMFYVNWRNDRWAYRGYRAEGLLGFRDYLRSLARRPMVYQLLDPADPWPFVRAVASNARQRLVKWMSAGRASEP